MLLSFTQFDLSKPPDMKWKAGDQADIDIPSDPIEAHGTDALPLPEQADPEVAGVEFQGGSHMLSL
jgi:hypothetical protein